MPHAALGRNAPCPCGSGRKYRHCHGRRRSVSRASRTGWIVASSAALLVAALVFAIRGIHPVAPATQRVMDAPAGAVLPPAGKRAEGGPEPAPYTYDARSNRHWDPEHHHWHFGPPPSAAERATRAARGVPSPREAAATAAPLPAATDSGSGAATSSR